MRAFVFEMLFKIKQFLLCHFLVTREKTNQLTFGNVEVGTFIAFILEVIK